MFLDKVGNFQYIIRKWVDVLKERQDFKKKKANSDNLAWIYWELYLSFRYVLGFDL